MGFHKTVRGGLTAQHLAQTLELELQGNEAAMASHAAPLARAGEGALSFCMGQAHWPALEGTKASILVVDGASAEHAPKGATLLLSKTPHADFAKAAALLYPTQPDPWEGVAAQAYIHPDAEIAEGAIIAPYAVVEAGAKLGKGVYVGPGCHVGQGVEIGAGSRLESGCTVRYATLGKNCLLHPGVRVGQDGFGFAFDGKMVVKVPQLGQVIIEDDVELGAGTTVDRGALEDTVIGRGCKIDNLVQIAHNVKIGPMCQISGQVGIAGSATLGSRVIIGGQVAIVGHIEIADGVQIAGRAGVTKSITQAGSVVGGLPAVPIRIWRRQMAALNRLAKSPAKEEKA